jgi:hypothetical protein
MDVLESCPLTANIIAQLRLFLESKSNPARPKQLKRLNKLIIDFVNITTSTSSPQEWKLEPESSTREFFEGLDDQIQIQLYKIKYKTPLNTRPSQSKICLKS